MSNITAMHQSALGLCNDYASFGLGLAKAFLIVALIAAIAETAVALLAKIKALRAGGNGQIAAAAAPDPGALAKLLEALKGLLQALTGLPAWIALLLAGLALLWLSTQRPELCTSLEPDERRNVSP